MILIAEDQQVFQELFLLILKKLGHETILAIDGGEALEKALSSQPDLVFMDIQMPVMNGYEVTENLRKRGFMKPIIAVTASNDPNEWDYCIKAGIDDLLVKPVKPKDVEKMLLKWLDTNVEVPLEKTGDSPAASPAKQNAIFDSAYMLNTFMNNDELALSLLARFIERTVNQLISLPDLEKAENWEGARQTAHMLKGAAFTMGGSELGKAAARLELAYRDQLMEEMAEAFPLLQKAFDNYKKEAEDFLESRK